jgi:hypothetical protein
MLFWLLDNANFFYFLLATIALALCVYGWLTTRARFIVYGLIPVALIVLLWLLGKVVITDRQQIINNLDAMAAATIANDREALFRYVASDFAFGTLKRDDLYQRTSKSVQGFRVKDIRLTDQRVELNGDKAQVAFDFNAFADDGNLPASAKATFVREAGVWKMQRLEVYHFRSNERQRIPGID